jgi:hypothetical protein
MIVPTVVVPPIAGACTGCTGVARGAAHAANAAGKPSQINTLIGHLARLSIIMSSSEYHKRGPGRGIDGFTLPLR